jgi:chemotaxis protein MotB
MLHGRRRREEGHVNHERWVLSYADFVTLMFALFVAMYAISMKDHKGAQEMSQSIRKAMESGGLVGTIQELMKASEKLDKKVASSPAASHQSADASLAKAFAHLQGQMKKELASGSIRLSLEARGLVITLQEKPFFPSGGDVISETTYGTIAQLAKTINALPNGVRLEGHTDSVPIRNSRFQNNWELSTARSIALLQLFQSRFGSDAAKFSVTGYADNVPVASNDTEDGRAQNRRVEIVVLSEREKARL